MPDINAYALNMELRLSDAASGAMSGIKDAATDVNDQVAKANQQLIQYATLLGKAEFAASKLQNVRWDELSPTELGSAMAQYEALGDLADELLNKVGRTRQEEELIVDAMVAREAFAAGMLDKVDEVVKRVEKESKLIDDILKNEKALKKLSVEDLDRVKLLHKEVKAIHKIGLDVEGMDEERVKNLGKALKTMEATSKKADSMKKHLQGAAGFVRDVGVGGRLPDFIANLTSLSMILKLLAVIGFKNILDAQEAFRTATFRNVGTIDEMTEMATELQGELGTTAKQAIRAAKALAEVGFTDKAFKELVKTNFQFTKATGVSAETTALFQRRMAAVTGSSDAAAPALQRVASRMRDVGLTAKEAESLLQTLSQQLLTLQAFYGEEAAARFADTLTDIAAAAKAAGVDVEDVQRTFMKFATSPKAAQELLALAQMSVEDFTKAMQGGAEEQMQAFQMIATAMARAQEMGEDSTLVLEAMAAEYGLNAGQLEAFAMTAQKVGKVSNEAIKPLGETATESRETVAEQFEIMGGKIMAFVQTALLPLAEGITWVLVQITDFIKWVDAGLTELGLFGDVIKWVGKAVLITAIAIGALGLAFKVLGGILTPFKGIFAFVTKGLSGVGAAAQKAGTGAGAGALKMLGQAISSFFQTMAKVPVTAILKTALVLGILVGTLFLLALAAKMLGTEGIPALIALTVAIIGIAVAMYILAPALAALGSMGMIAIPILLVLGIVIAGIALAVGFAVKMIMEGVAVALPALTAFAEVIIAALGEIVTAGILGIIAGPGLVLMAAGLIALAGALTIMGAAGGLLDLVGAGPVAGAKRLAKALRLLVGPLRGMGQALKGVDFTGFYNTLWMFQNANAGRIRAVAAALDAVGSAAYKLAMAALWGATIEQIHTVKMTEATARTQEADRRAKAQVEAVDRVTDKLDAVIDKIGATDMEKLMTLLGTYLPQIAEGGEKETGLATPTNQWVS